MNQTDRSIISQYRTSLMGFSILWIAIFHASLSIPNQVLNTVKALGYGGVDFFLFLSGMGLYSSLRKNPDTLSFYKRRVFRLMPFYLPFLILWFLYVTRNMNLTLNQTLRFFLGNIFMTGWAVGMKYQFNWYVQALFWFYFAAPVIYAFLTGAKHKTRMDLLLVLAAIGFSLTFVHEKTLMAFSRIPVFILGMIFAARRDDWSRQDRIRLRLFSFVIMVIGFAAVIYCLYRYRQFLKPYGLFWYPFLLITPGFCYWSALLFQKIDTLKLLRPVMWILNIAGAASFEIYMFHLAFYKYLPDKLGISGNFGWLFLILFSIIIGILYHFLIVWIQALIKRTISVKKENCNANQ